MSNEIRKLLKPQYVNNFKCIGSECQDSCCIGWQVYIDKETYKRYRRCTDQTLRLEMDRHVKRRRADAGEVSYAKIKMNNDGTCPFLDEGKLCTIQRKLGEQYLSVTCATYPRIANSVNDIVEKSLTMSCPEAARLALLNPLPMEFDETFESVKLKNIGGLNLDTHGIKNSHRPEWHFWELRIFIISLLQNRTYSLWQRLVILGFFCRDLEQLVNRTKVDDIPVLIGTYLNRLEHRIYTDELDRIPSEMTIQMNLMRQLVEARMATTNNRRFRKCFEEFINGIGYDSNANKEDAGKRYAMAYKNYYRKFMVQHEYILENYLVNYVFKNHFPLHGERSIFDNYVLLVIHIAMIKMLLIGMAGFHKDQFGVEHVIKLIQSFAKSIEHNKAYLRNIMAVFKENKFNTMAYMAILIKNDAV